MSPTEIEQHQRFLRALTAHEPAVRAFIRRLVPSRSDADDVMQEVALVLWEKFSEFRPEADFRAWAYGIARFKVLAWLRDKGRDRLVLSEEVVEMMAEETTQDDSRLHQQRQALELCSQKLAPDQRELLMLAYQPEARIQQVAETSGRSVPGFYQWLHRIRRLLLDCIQREIGKEEAQ